MTLFVSTPKRIYEISDAYLMALSFILFFAVTKIVKEVKFSDFKKKDPVLSQFKDLGDHYVRQNSCLMNDLHDIIELRID